MIPVYPLRRRFWDAWKLRTESRNVKDKAYKIPYTYKGKDYGVITALPYNEFTPELAKFRESFLEHYPLDWGEYAVSYMWIDSDYPWHVDNEVTKSQHNRKGVKCAINIILEGHSTAVEYEGGRKYIYEAAVINTSELHRVIPADERVMARISFKDKTFNQVVEGIKEWQGKNI